MINSFYLTVVFIGTALVTVITASDTLYVNLENSKINWTGRKVTGEHTGTLNLADGWIIIQQDYLMGGKLIFDMTSINNTDLESPEWKKKLEDHLMAKDFFFADSFPHAVLEIKNHPQILDDNSKTYNQLIADLTIRGITHEINFPLEISQTKSIHNAEGTIDIDRTLFNIRYKSGTFFEDLGDRMIYDDFTVQFSVQTKAIQLK